MTVSPPARFKFMMDNYIKPNCDFVSIMDDDVAKAMQTEELQEVIAEGGPNLRKIFRQWSKADPGQSKGKGSTMSMSECEHPHNTDHPPKRWPYSPRHCGALSIECIEWP